MSGNQLSGALLVKRAQRYTPAPRVRINPVYEELHKLNPKFEAKTLEKKFNDLEPYIIRLVDAARMANRMAWVRDFLAPVVAALQSGGEPLRCTSHFACSINRDVLAESASLADYLADKSEAHKDALRVQTIRLQGEVAELLIALGPA